VSVLADQFRPGTFVDAFRFMGDNPGLLAHKTAQHLELSGAALGIALLLALPLGVWLGHLHRGSFVAISVSNFGRALPSLVLIAFGLTILGIGFWNNTVALVVLAIALPLVFAGIRIAAIFVIATATIAAIAGGGGLGEIIVNQASYRLAGVVAASLWVSFLAFAAAAILGLARRALSPRGAPAR
jgi:osmoprotectant transport system permease protein